MRLSHSTQNNKLVILNFYADWCGTCQTMETLLDRIQKQLSHCVELVHVDVDKNPQIRSMYRVSSIPSFILLKEGKETARYTGLITFRDMERFISENI